MIKSKFSLVEKAKLAKMTLLMYCLLALIPISLLNNPVALFILISSTYLSMIQFRYNNYIFFLLIAASITLSNSFFDAAAYTFSIIPILLSTVQIKKLDLKDAERGIYSRIKEFELANPEWWLCLLCLLLFKVKLGYLVVPLAIYYYFKKYDPRTFISVSIVLLTISAGLLNHSEKMANDVAILSYYFLVIGVVGSLIEYIREERSKEAENHSENNRTRNKGVWGSK